MRLSLEQADEYCDRAVDHLNSECGALQNGLKQLKDEIRSLLARYDGFRMNDGEKAPGWLLHELRKLSAI